MVKILLSECRAEYKESSNTLSAHKQELLATSNLGSDIRSIQGFKGKSYKGLNIIIENNELKISKFNFRGILSIIFIIINKIFYYIQ